MRVLIACKVATRVLRVPVEGVMKKMLKEFIADESGATAIEYTIMAAGIALVIIVAVNAVGSAVNQKFVDIKSVIP